jgi:PAS domain S-box-containing protein
MNKMIDNKVIPRTNFDDKLYAILSEQNEKCLRCLLEVSTEGIFLCTLDGKIRDVNDQACNMYYYTKEEFRDLNIKTILTNGLTETFHIINDKAPDICNRFDGGITVRKNGALFPVDIKTRIVNTDGKKRLIVFVRDITHQRNKELELKQAKERAEEMDQLKSAFLSNMSHELRTPMIGILGYAKMLSDEILDPKHKEMAEIILKSGNRLTEILNMILDLSKIESNQVQINNQRIKPAAIINEVINQHKLSAKEKKLYLKTDINAEDITAFIDEKIYFQILSNLVNNAVKYTHTGGVTVRLSKEIINNQAYIETSVIDTGIGIDKKFHNRIFEPFRQESEGLNRRYEGTGLGLTIAKKLTKLLKGVIKMESSIGKGSTFTISLPVENSMNEIIHEDQDDAGYKLENTTDRIPKVLIVEDDDITRDILKIFLKGVSIIDGVSSGEEALELAESKKYDIILMDINLKGINGLETVSRIRSMKDYKSTPIVAVTAYAMMGDKEKFLSAGCTHYISKPFFKKDLVDLLTAILPRRD